MNFAKLKNEISNRKISHSKKWGSWNETRKANKTDPQKILHATNIREARKSVKKYYEVLNIM